MDRPALSHVEALIDTALHYLREASEVLGLVKAEGELPDTSAVFHGESFLHRGMANVDTALYYFRVANDIKE